MLQFPARSAKIFQVTWVWMCGCCWLAEGREGREGRESDWNALVLCGLTWVGMVPGVHIGCVLSCGVAAGRQSYAKTRPQGGVRGLALIIGVCWRLTGGQCATAAGQWGGASCSSGG